MWQKLYFSQGVIFKSNDDKLNKFKNPMNDSYTEGEV